MKTKEIELQPWDRQPNESSKSYQAFCAYRDAGPQRSRRKLVAEGKTAARLRQLMNWCSRHGWVARAEAYDDYTERLLRFENERDRRNMLRRHANVAVLGQSVAITALQRILNEMNEDPTRKLTPRDAGFLLDIGVRVERLSRGEPSEIAELGSSAYRPLRISLEQQAREIAQQAIEGVLGLSGTAAERTEGEETEAEATPTPGPAIDPFDLPPETEEPRE
jgi:hypothetical protein